MNILQALLLQSPASVSLAPLLTLWQFSPILLPGFFPITVETLLSIGFCFPAQTACLHKLVRNLYLFQPIFVLQEAGQ